jgi:hypothetical protein
MFCFLNEIKKCQNNKKCIHVLQGRLGPFKILNSRKNVNCKMVRLVADGRDLYRS